MAYLSCAHFTEISLHHKCLFYCVAESCIWIFADSRCVRTIRADKYHTTQKCQRSVTCLTQRAVDCLAGLDAEDQGITTSYNE